MFVIKQILIILIKKIEHYFITQFNEVEILRNSFISIEDFSGDEHSATFLIKHSCLLDHQTNIKHETPLHLLSSLNPMEIASDMMIGMCRVAQLILEYGADTNKKDAQGNTCLHRAILANNMDVFQELLKATNLSLDERNNDDHVPLWLALQQAEQKRKLRNTMQK